MKIEDVETAIAVAKPEELARIKAALRAREGFSGDPASVQLKNGPKAVANGVLIDDMLSAIVRVARQKGFEFTSEQQLKRSQGYGAFKTKVEQLRSYLKPDGWSRTESRAFMVLAVELLFKNLVDMNVAVSARTAMSHVHRIPGVVNTVFPGYYANGLIKWIVRAGIEDVRKK